MAVGADEAGVQADIRGLGRRDGLQLGGGEIVLGDAVLFKQLLQNTHLHPVLFVLLAGGAGAQENIQALAGDGLVERLFPLLTAQMGQQIGDDKLGLVPLTQPHGHHGAVLLGHHAVELQGDGHPLILADAAVVMGLEEGQLAVLIQGIRLQVQPGRVDMGGHDVCALGQALPAYHRQHDALVPIHPIDFVPGGQGRAPLIGLEARLFRQLHGHPGALALGFALLQEGLIQAAVALHGLQFLRLDAVIAVLPRRKQLFPQGLSFLTHGQIPPKSIF